MTTEQLKELEKLNERWANEHLETSADFNDLLTAVMDLIPDVLAHIKQLTAERDEEKAIVDRVWLGLGISTYEQAKPLAIDEHVKKLLAERDAAINRANIFEQSIKDAAPAYKRLLEERYAALKAFAEMRCRAEDAEHTLELISNQECEHIHPNGCECCLDASCIKDLAREGAGKSDLYLRYLKSLTREVELARLIKELDHKIHSNYDWNSDKERVTLRVGHALSTDCGKGYHHNEEWKPVVDELERLRDVVCEEDAKIIDEALAHAAKLTEGQ